MLRKLAALAALLASLAPAAARGAEAFAVMPVAPPPGPDAALVDLSVALRTALEIRGSGGLSPETLRNRMTGTTPAEALAASDAAYRAALDVHAAGDFEGSIRALRAVIAELEALPAGAEVHERWTRAMLRLARSEQAVGRRSEAVAVLERLLRVDPEVEVDRRLYPPGFQRLVEEVRAEIRALWTRKLTVEAQPGVRVFVEGREVAAEPGVLELPPGRYRISGALGEIRSREVDVDLTTEDRTVALDVSLAELLRPDRGPGLAVAAADRDRLAAVARFLDLDRLVTVRLDVQGDRTWVAASLLDARRGAAPVEGRVRLADGAFPPGGADALAAFLLAGEASPLVEPSPAVGLSPVPPRAGEPRRGLLAWDGVKRPEARPYGWWATGTALAAVTLAVVSVTQYAQANKAYSSAESMQTPDGGVAFGHTVAEYNAAIGKGDRARQTATATAIGAGVCAATSIVLAVISYHRTGEIGPLRF